MFTQIADGRTDLVFEHLNNGNQATDADAHGTSLIQWCAYHGDVSAIKHLLSHGASLATLGENMGLASACFHGHWQLTQYLLEQGADPNHPNSENGETPLHQSLCKANRPVYEHIVTLLLDSGADVNAKTTNNKETGGFMRDCRTRGETPLHRAAAFSNKKIIEKLLAAGADLKALDSNNDTPLSWASWHLRPPEILRLLCYRPHHIHPDNQASYDHGVGWNQLDSVFMGKPHLSKHK